VGENSPDVMLMIAWHFGRIFLIFVVVVVVVGVVVFVVVVVLLLLVVGRFM